MKTVVVLFFFDISRDTDKMTTSLTSTTHTHTQSAAVWVGCEKHERARCRTPAFLFFFKASQLVCWNANDDMRQHPERRSCCRKGAAAAAFQRVTGACKEQKTTTARNLTT